MTTACMGPQTPPPYVSRNENGQLNAKWRQSKFLYVSADISVDGRTIEYELRAGFKHQKGEATEWAEPIRRTLAKITENKALDAE